MDRSIYTALNSMNILRDNQSVTAQNLANISVTGFQKDIQINFASVYLDRDKVTNIVMTQSQRSSRGQLNLNNT